MMLMHKYKEYLAAIAADEVKLAEIEDIVCGTLERMKLFCPEEYKNLLCKIHCVVYGMHFDETLAKKAVAAMKNVDGTEGAHWTLEQTSALAEQIGITDKFDFYYVINMLYSDFSHVLGNAPEVYVKLAKAYICDPDADEGKAFRCWAARE